MKTQYVESLVVEVDVRYKPLSRRASFSSSSSVMMINPLEYCEAYGGGADDRVEWRGRTGGSSICPCGLVNLINEFCVTLMPPGRRMWFLLGGVVSSSIL
jgi:hypothetical protein